MNTRDKEIAIEIVNNPDKMAFFKRKAAPYKGVTIADLIKLYINQNGICALCGDDIVFDTKNTHIDHIVPRAKGGEDEIENFEFACSTCNYAKRDMSLKEFVLMCLKVENEYHKTDILPKEEINKIVQRRWKKESKKSKKA